METTEKTERVEFWGVVELFGHQKIAGHVSSAEIGGCSFLRVDVPEVGEGDLRAPGCTKYYGNGAIYAIHPTTEEVARAAAERLAVSGGAPLPVYVPELEAAHRTIQQARRLREEQAPARALPAGAAGTEDDEEEYGDDGEWNLGDDLEI